MMFFWYCYRSRYGLAESGGGNLKRSAINNSLLDLTDNHNHLLAYPGFTGAPEKPIRRGSVGSLGRTIMLNGALIFPVESGLLGRKLS